MKLLQEAFREESEQDSSFKHMFWEHTVIKCTELLQFLMQHLTDNRISNPRIQWECDYKGVCFCKCLFKISAQQQPAHSKLFYTTPRAHIRTIYPAAVSRSCLNIYFWVYCILPLFIHPFGTDSLFILLLIWLISGSLPCYFQASCCDREQNTMIPFLDQLLQSHPGGLCSIYSSLPYLFSTSG